MPGYQGHTGARRYGSSPPARDGQGRCKRCGAAIVWAKTINEKAMPLNGAPVQESMVTPNVAVMTDVAGVLRARVVTAKHPIESYERPAVAHFATCPVKP